MDGNDIGRATNGLPKPAGQGLFRKDWANARTVLKDVIDNSGKKLMLMQVP